MKLVLTHLIALSIILGCAATDADAQKRTRKRTTTHSRTTKKHAPAPTLPASMPPADISSRQADGDVPVPQAGSLTPDMKKPKKVVIVPAPPPPPGPDVRPPYPKR